MVILLFEYLHRKRVSNFYDVELKFRLLLFESPWSLKIFLTDIIGHQVSELVSARVVQSRNTFFVVK